jgi:Tfp pilus assembly protein PilF
MPNESFLARHRSRLIRALAVALPLVVVLMTAWAFWPSLGNGFVNWDDEINFVRNPHFRGLGWPEVRWAFRTLLMGHYIPVTWLTFGLDYTLWGMDPFGYHLSNLLVHAGAVLAFYFVALRLLATAAGERSTAVRFGAAAAAAFFAVHPLRVESVAWITERRDGLSTLLALVAVLAYLAMVTATGRRRHALLAASLGVYALALLSKSMVMTLPLVLVILDVYPLRRLSLRWPGSAERLVWLEKLPYLTLGAVAAALAAYGQHVNDFFSPLTDLAWTARVALALYSAWFYVATSLLPFGLSPVYELPHPVDPLAPRFAGAALAVLVGGVALVLGRRRWPAALAAATAYVVMLAPVSGLAHAGHQVTNDRYSYFPSLPWALLLGAAVVAVARATAHGRLRRPLALAAAVVLAAWLVVLGAISRDQSRVWHDSETLWVAALDAEPTCSICHGNFGAYLADRGKMAPAVYHLQLAVRLRPDRPQTHHRLALALLKERRGPGAVPEAIRHLETALRLAPRDVENLEAYGAALIEDGRPAAALGPLGSALRTDPRHVIARTNFGTALEMLGAEDAALEQYTRAMAIDPASAPPRGALAMLHARRGNTAQALVHLEEVKRLDPALAESLQPRVTGGSTP